MERNEKKGALYKEVREGEKVNPFIVHKWALKTRLKISGEK